MLEPVPMALFSNNTVTDCNGHAFGPGESKVMTAVVEATPVDGAPSNLAVVGRYVLSAQIWDLLQFTPPGAVFCFTILSEGLPKSQIEAAACGRAIIATDASGCKTQLNPVKQGC